jgi:hypothetical protein
MRTKKAYPVGPLRLALAAAAIAAFPAVSNAAITGIFFEPVSTEQGCIDVTGGTGTFEGTWKADGVAIGPVTGIVSRPALKCDNTVGTGSFVFRTPPGGPEGLDVELRVNDEPVATTVHFPLVRRSATTAYFRELPAAATVNGVPVVGPAFDLTPVPGAAFLVTSQANGHPVTMRYIPTSIDRAFFSATSDRDQTSVSVSNVMPNVDLLMELRRADGTLVSSQTTRVRTGSSTGFFTGPSVGSAGSVRISQPGIFDRTRAFATAELRSDGFRVALPQGALSATYVPFFTLHPAASAVADPLGPCRTLQAAGPLPSECTGLTTPRTEVVASELLPVASDGLYVNSFWDLNDTTLVWSGLQPGVSFDAPSGRVDAFLAGSDILTGSLTVPRPLRPLPSISRAPASARAMAQQRMAVTRTPSLRKSWPTPPSASRMDQLPSQRPLPWKPPSLQVRSPAEHAPGPEFG